MDELFNKRMGVALKSGSLGGKLLEDSDLLVERNFSNDANFKTGMLYDWDMNELEEVEFKFEKTKTWTAEGNAVEYMIHFKPNYNPEYLFKDKYFKKDGRERFGFYIDVLDVPKNKKEKWLILGKDDRVAFDRYNAFKCDWCFEWITDGKYHNCIGCIRDAQDSSMKNLKDDGLGGSIVNDELSILMPSNKNVANISLGTRFMIGDSSAQPRVYEAVRLQDTSPIGTTKVYLKQRLYNSHTDVCGIVNEMSTNDFCFDLPLPDLPEGFGGQYHMICNCLKSKGLPVEPSQKDVDWKLNCTAKYLYINGQEVIIKATSSNEDALCEWHIFVDDEEYPRGDLLDYFDITITDREFRIKAINKVMSKYVVKVAIYDLEKSYYDSVEMEVRL